MCIRLDLSNDGGCTMLKTREWWSRAGFRTRVKPNRKTYARKAKDTQKVSEIWQSPRVGDMAPAETPSQKPSKRAIFSPNTDFITTIKNMPDSRHELFEMTKKEVEHHRRWLYSINRDNVFKYYTRYVEDRYLMVWRMNR